MRPLLLSIALPLALFVALLGAIGLGLAQPALAVQPLATHTRLLVDSSPTPNTPVCPPGGSGSCG